MAGVNLLHQHAVRRGRGAAEKRRSVRFVTVGARMAAAVGLSDNQHVDAVITAFLHTLLHFRQPCGITGCVGLDHIEVAETVRKQHLGPVQRLPAGEFLQDPRRKRQRHGCRRDQNSARRGFLFSQPVQAGKFR